MQIGELLSKLGGVAPDRQRRMEYLQRALAVFRELGARTRMREVQSQVHSAIWAVRTWADRVQWKSFHCDKQPIWIQHLRD